MTISVTFNSGYQLYDNESIENVRCIRELQKERFALEEIIEKLIRRGSQT